MSLKLFVWTLNKKNFGDLKKLFRSPIPRQYFVYLLSFSFVAIFKCFFHRVTKNWIPKTSAKMRNCHGAEKRVAAKRRKRKGSVRRMEAVFSGVMSSVLRCRRWWHWTRPTATVGRRPATAAARQPPSQYDDGALFSSSNEGHRRPCRRCCLSLLLVGSSEVRAWVCLVGSVFMLLLLTTIAFLVVQQSSSPSLSILGELSTTEDQQQQQTTVVKQYNSSSALSIVEALCAEWRAGRYAGDFCATLCGGDDAGGGMAPRRNWTLADYTRGGTKHVLKLHIDGRDSVLKMQFPYANEYDQQIDFERLDEEQFIDMVLELVNDRLRLDWPRRHKDYLLRRIWPPLTADGGNKHWRRALNAAEKRSVWALLQQDEFINSAMLRMSRVTPKLLGVCGHAYRAEYLVPFRMKPYYLNLKAKILVHLMGTLKLFYEFLNEPLQWCDVKFENLGLSADYPKRFVVMDGDMLYTESRLNALFQQQRCTNDTECGLFDCAARCNTTSRHCTARTDENIDVFCKKLVTQQLFGSFWSKSNRYLAACHEQATPVQRLKSLQLSWAWTLSDV